MSVERSGRRNESANDSKEVMKGALLKFKMFDMFGVTALLAFLPLFFVFEDFRGRPMGLLALGIAAFMIWSLISLKISGLLDLILKKGSADAR